MSYDLAENIDFLISSNFDQSEEDIVDYYNRTHSDDLHISMPLAENGQYQLSQFQVWLSEYYRQWGPSGA